MVGLLCVEDQSHSMLYKKMPEKSRIAVKIELFDQILSEIANHKEPRSDQASGNMVEGYYLPKPHIWNDHFDPLHVLLRGINHREEFHKSMERFKSL